MDRTAPPPAVTPALPAGAAGLILCPSCGGGPLATPVCPACGFEAATEGAALDLRTDRTADTLLDIAAYDGAHGVAGRPDPRFFDAFRGLLEPQGVAIRGRVLELGCGSGYLTAALLDTGRFDEIHSGDISPGFMARMHERIARMDGADTVRGYLFDANALPFRSGAFDLVFGNSILHHFARFENTLREAHRVLKPGGAAVFGEPLLDGHAFVSLAAGLILRLAVAAEDAAMTSRHRLALDAIRGRARVKAANLAGPRDNLAAIEDKFQFPSRALVRRQLLRSFAQISLDPAPLDAYGAVFRSIGEDFGEPMRPWLYSVFAQIAFIR
jgi:SAM-dependent methyltransferase